MYQRTTRLFNKIFPNGIDKISDKDLQSALELCERTIIKNIKEKLKTMCSD